MIRVRSCVVQGCCTLPIMDCDPSGKAHIYVHLRADKETLDRKHVHPCFASSQTNKLSLLEWASGVFLPWWRCSRGAADPGGHRQEHQGAAVQEGGGDGRGWDQHAEWHPRFQVKSLDVVFCIVVFLQISCKYQMCSGVYQLIILPQDSRQRSL